MAQSSPPPLDPSSAPIMEGFVPTPLHREAFRAKFLRKIRENPLVPIGCLTTAGALTYGLICFHRGNTRQSQLMMRTRVVAQGFTIAALVVGMVATALKSQK
ncbi:HIG1 domain family member 2A, mitochondrial [Carettochelys insculpta]|uniref:HIG1 domain family member 2A, mitochondrial n=1 Tax=Carettochelys insculpta TaxID=44489 RepID=UPI003EB9EA61